MTSFSFSSSSSMSDICCLAAGIAGNLFAFVLFLSPVPTFRRIVRNKSTEDFSCLPYIYALLNCLICLWYGLPFVSHGIILVATVNSIGAVFQLTYVLLFIIHANNEKKMKTSLMLFAVFAVFGCIVAISLECFSSSSRKMFVGFLSVASLISMFASPLFIIRLVIRTRSVEFMPFYLSLATFLMSFSFLLYGLFEEDVFIAVPNGIGSILGAIQLFIYAYYSRASARDTQKPLLG